MTHRDEIIERFKRDAAEALRLHIRRAGLTQQAAADQAEVNRADLNQIINGRTAGHSLSKILGIAATLGMDVRVELMEV